ncbi:hypothetical protein F939_02111, partial [Acinetobacter radioresistens DSM 6976 = NBRC 102413 = CIP 103788]
LRFLIMVRHRLDDLEKMKLTDLKLQHVRHRLDDLEKCIS